MTMGYDAFLSRAAEAMQQSPIRQMGTIAAQRADLISFAPGYPGPDSFAWDDYRAITDRLLRELRASDLPCPGAVPQRPYPDGTFGLQRRDRVRSPAQFLRHDQRLVDRQCQQTRLGAI